jgi:holo-[acyl-carrier protein] synthase
VPVRVGIDTVLVESVREAIRVHGEHYLERVYTPAELEDCRVNDRVDCQRLAARFAAKEAALKVLRPDTEGINLQTIEVLRRPAGWVELKLTGPAADLAAKAGLGDLAVSLTHEPEIASAVVVGELV